MCHQVHDAWIALAPQRRETSALSYDHEVNQTTSPATLTTEDDVFLYASVLCGEPIAVVARISSSLLTSGGS